METGTQDGLGTALSCAKRQEGWPKALSHPIRLTTMLDASELERYARHIVLREVGGPGQARLKAARVLVVGAGGLGSPAILYLAAAGVGTIGIVDFDTVSLSNLQRQIAHATTDIGRLKTDSARDAANAINPRVVIETHPARLSGENALNLIRGYDI